MTPNEILDGLRSGDDAQITAAIDEARLSTNPVLVSTLGAVLKEAQTPSDMRLHIIDALIAHADKSAVRWIGEVVAQSREADLRSAGLAALVELGKYDAIPYLVAVADRDDGKLILRQVIADVTVELSGSPAAQKTANDALNLILKALADDKRPPLLRVALAEVLGGVTQPATIERMCDILQAEQQKGKEGSIEVLDAIVAALGEIGNPIALRPLCSVLERSKSEFIRRRVALAIGRFKQTDTAVPTLLQFLLTDADAEVKQHTRAALEGKGKWQNKAGSLMSVVRDKAIDRATLDANSVVDAISADDAQQDNKLLVADFLISKAVDYVEEPRITAVLAALIIACAGGSTAIAGERISRCESDNKLPAGKLQKLRIEVGGTSALDPLLQQLEENLKTYFREPIHELNKATHASWLNTILWAKRGFITRMVMSVIVFIAGLILVFSSYVFVLTNKLTIEQTVGPGVAFVSGLVAVIFSVYRGPLRDIRQSINDLGVASATFMAFVHGILETSHTFSYHYLQRGVSYEDLKASTKVIEDMVNNTIRLLDQDTGRRRANPATKASANPTETKAATEPKSDDKSDDTGKE